MTGTTIALIASAIDADDPNHLAQALLCAASDGIDVTTLIN
jgi:hypothetical protein